MRLLVGLPLLLAEEPIEARWLSLTFKVLLLLPPTFLFAAAAAATTASFFILAAAVEAPLLASLTTPTRHPLRRRHVATQTNFSPGRHGTTTMEPRYSAPRMEPTERLEAASRKFMRVREEEEEESIWMARARVSGGGRISLLGGWVDHSGGRHFL
jgi:hypothetical protein